MKVEFEFWRKDLNKRLKPRYSDEERSAHPNILLRINFGDPYAARTDRSVLVVCDCSRAFVLTLYHAKQRGLDKADTLFVIGKKMKETLKTAIFR